MDTDMRVERVRTAWQKATEGILETGHLLLEAKVELSFREFLHMTSTGLPFSSATADKYMCVAEHEVLGAIKNARYLPPDLDTLYKLSKLPPEKVEEAIIKRVINPGMDNISLAELYRECGYSGEDAL